MDTLFAPAKPDTSALRRLAGLSVLSVQTVLRTEHASLRNAETLVRESVALMHVAMLSTTTPFVLARLVTLVILLCVVSKKNVSML